MFRKPKSKTVDNSARNIRRRTDDEIDNTSITTTPLAAAAPLQSDSNKNNEESNQNYSIQEKDHSKPIHHGLSFTGEEDDDVANFKLKKSNAHHRHSNKIGKKEGASGRLHASTKVSIKEEEDDHQHITATAPNSNGKASENITEDILSDEPEITKMKPEQIDLLEKAFPTTFSGIPDAKAVYEARKKREMMRQGLSGPGEYIPLDDTIRFEGSRGKGISGERARLIREDENDLSDEEVTGSFYSARKLLQNDEERRREEQAHFLEIEQADSDDDEVMLVKGRDQNRRNQGEEQHRQTEEEEEEEDELQRWEREQIRKGVSSNKVIQLRDEFRATSLSYRRNQKTLYTDGGEAGEAEMEIDIDIDEGMMIEEPIKDVESKQKQLPIDDSVLPISLKDILENFQQRLEDKKEMRNSQDAELTRAQQQIAQNTDLIHKMEQGMPELEQRFKMFQQVRMYINDLLDCLNEKIGQIDELEEKVMDMWKQRTEFLLKRRRQDVQDQYEHCLATAVGKTFIAPNPEFSQRETEREARRNRRRKQRMPLAAVHYEGMSTDDEETQSRAVYYSDNLDAIHQSAQDIFMDVEDDYCGIEQILPHILNWLVIDPRSFEDAYIPLCLPKLLSPFIRLQMLKWRPLKDSTQILQSFPWYRQLLLAGLENTGLDTLEHPVLVQLIPTVVEKVVLPKIARIIREQWDPLSLSESINLAKLLGTLVNEYPMAESKQMNQILEQVRNKIRESLEIDMFVPLYTKEAIESTETGCGAFLDRQFWKAVKLMNSILCFRAILTDLCLEELLMEGLINRSAVMALQFSILTNPSTAEKCRLLIRQIPSSWLPPKRPNSYRPLAMLVKQVAEIHQQRNKEFAKEALRFVSQALKDNVKEETEIIQQDENGLRR